MQTAATGWRVILFCAVLVVLSACAKQGEHPPVQPEEEQWQCRLTGAVNATLDFTLLKEGTPGQGGKLSPGAILYITQPFSSATGVRLDGSFQDGTIMLHLRNGYPCPAMGRLQGVVEPGIASGTWILDHLGTLGPVQGKWTAATTSIDKAPSRLASSAPTSFRGLDWRVNWRGIPTLVLNEALSSAGGRIQHFTRSDEILRLGNIPLLSVRYAFFDSRLFHAVMDFETQHAAAVFGAYIEKYGPSMNAYDSQGDLSSAFWEWPDVRIVLHFSKTNKSRVEYFYLPIWKNAVECVAGLKNSGM